MDKLTVTEIFLVPCVYTGRVPFVYMGINIRVYGLRSNLQRLLYMYCDWQAVVPKASKLFGRTFGMERGVT